jgi:polar amino acid transport system permease protein
MKASEMRRSFTVRMQEQSSQPNIGDAADRIVRLKHPWRWVGAGIALLFSAMLVHALITQPGFQWRIVSKYLFSHLILEGVLVTIELTATAMIVGISLGLLMAVMRLSHNPVFSYFARLYISVFRAVPALVQMIFWFNMAALIPVLSLGIPFGPAFVSFSATSVFSPFLAATLGLGLAEAAYMAEIFRGGITTVPNGQSDAARSMGLRRGAALRYVVLPQAMKGVIPPTGNEVIGMLKYTSLASVISVTELLQSATLIFNRTFETVPLLIVAALWYLVLTTALTIIQRRIERRFGRGTVQEEPALLSHVFRNALARRRRQGLRTTGAA